MSTLPGDENSQGNPSGFLARDEFVESLKVYTQKFNLPVQTGITVTKISKGSTGENYHIQTTAGAMTADNVVIASGSQNHPKMPSVSSDVPDSLMQLHSGEYKRPDALPDGATLVVGSGQSGVQVVEDLLRAGRKVYLATSRVGRFVRRFRGRDMLVWATDIGFFSQRISELADPNMAKMTQPQISGTHGGHTVSLQSLEKMGAILLGRYQGYRVNKFHFENNLVEHIMFADQVSAKFRNMVDDFIDKQGIDAPPPEVDEADRADPKPEDRQAPAALDPAKVGITSIIWCTGFGGNFNWIEDIDLDEKGIPVHENGVSPKAGLYYCGFPWLTKRRSGLIDGIKEDAARIVELIS
jgi:putative flavoprotein involved in K+ transport